MTVGFIENSRNKIGEDENEKLNFISFTYRCSKYTLVGACS